MDEIEAIDRHQMYWAAMEESSLAEISNGVTDYGPSGEVVNHGPWEPRAVSAVLIDWFEKGLIELYEMPVAGSSHRGDRVARDLDERGALDQETARNRLRSPEQWSGGDEIWTVTRIRVTESGEQVIPQMLA